MELFKPLWKSEDSKKRSKWIIEKSKQDNVEHQKILAELSKHDCSTCKIAVEKIFLVNIQNTIITSLQLSKAEIK